jgi:hypothetical protein
MRTTGTTVLLLAALLAALAACSPPKSETIALCQSKAVLEGRGHPLDASDIGELTEACMLTKGYALKEDGPLCSDNAATAVNPKCYYRNTVMGRLAARFSGD